MAKPNKLQKPVQPTQKSTAPVAPAQRPNVTKQRIIKNDTLVFGRANYIWMLIGLGVIAVGYLCMAGGAMPSPDVWDESIIYSPMRIVVAPFLILLGLGIEIYAIFKKDNTVVGTGEIA